MSTLGEFELIRTLFASQCIDDPSVIRGIGDDAAVIATPPGMHLITCTDALVQGRHFWGDWGYIEAHAHAIGYKAVAVNVSDLAAMGARPHHLLLALCLPKRLAQMSWLQEFARGLFEAATRFGCTLVGGDTTAADALTLTITANGFTASPVYRSGALAGDGIYVTGTLGGAAYALTHPNSAQEALLYPVARVDAGIKLATHASAMADISDGLWQDLGHIADASGLGFTLDMDALPLADVDAPDDMRIRLGLCGGEDYELVFCLPAGASMPALNVPTRRIGTMTADKARILYHNGCDVGSQYLQQTGYRHF